MLIAAGGFFSSTGHGPELLVGAGILGLLWTLFKATPKVARIVVKLDQATDVVLGVGEKPDIGTRMQFVEAELKPNGGGSMRDVVNKTALHVTDLTTQVASAAGRAEEAKAAADQVAAELILSNEQAARERARLSQELKEGRGLVTVLLNTLDDFAATNHQKEIAYIRALKALGIDLTEVADRLVEEGGE